MVGTTKRIALAKRVDLGWVLAVLSAGWFGPVAYGQQTPVPADDVVASGETAADDPANTLATEQQDVAERFGRLETLLLRSADLESAENPSRAALLQQAVQLSKQAQLNELLANAASQLELGQFSEAIENQKASRENLKRLLELLQSENREERIREQRDQVRRWIEETDRLLRMQSSLRGRTEGGQDVQQSASDQAKLSDKALQISDDLSGDSESKDREAGKSADAQREPPAEEGTPDARSDSEPGESSQSDSSPGAKPDDSGQGTQDPSADKPSAGQESQSPSENDSEAGKPDSQDGSDSPSESSSKPAEEGSPNPPGGSPPSQDQPSQQPASNPGQPSTQESESPSGEGQSASGPAENGEQSQSQTPTERAQQRIQQAQQKMQEAQQQLENAERQGAIEKQREAEERLREAIEELEEILRQLREEEVERSLASLETRLRRMLEMQIKVVEETTRLQEIVNTESTRQVQILAGKLGLDERKILAEGERAYLLLREEGSSAAFPEAIEQLNTDIGTVAERLNAGDVGKLTLVIEQEIVSSLEEMVQALVQVQKENREKQQQQQQGQPPQGEPGDQPLVDKLAELRLIRTLQMRINNRTDSLSKMLDDPSDSIGQASEADVLNQLQGLSERQSSIHRVTRDIVVGKGE